MNYPGLAKWINIERFAAGKVKGRKYRNRRIGELFKEIDLSEKKGTGIPTILRELRQNGSPEPELEMNLKEKRQCPNQCPNWKEQECRLF